jgi:hypothetical protein
MRSFAVCVVVKINKVIFRNCKAQYLSHSKQYTPVKKTITKENLGSGISNFVLAYYVRGPVFKTS